MLNMAAQQVFDLPQTRREHPLKPPSPRRPCGVSAQPHLQWPPHQRFFPAPPPLQLQTAGLPGDNRSRTVGCSQRLPHRLQHIIEPKLVLVARAVPPQPHHDRVFVEREVQDILVLWAKGRGETVIDVEISRERKDHEFLVGRGGGV